MLQVQLLDQGCVTKPETECCWWIIHIPVCRRKKLSIGCYASVGSYWKWAASAASTYAVAIKIQGRQFPMCDLFLMPLHPPTSKDRVCRLCCQDFQMLLSGWGRMTAPDLRLLSCSSLMQLCSSQGWGFIHGYKQFPQGWEQWSRPVPFSATCAKNKAFSEKNLDNFCSFPHIPPAYTVIGLGTLGDAFLPICFHISLCPRCPCICPVI